VADSITIPPPTGGATVVLNILPNENSNKLTVTAIEDGNRLITTYPDNSLHLGERFKVEVKPEFSEWWKVKDVFNGSKVSDGIWKVAGDPCNIILNKLFHLTVYTAGGNDPNEITFYKTKEGLDEDIINDISLIKFSIHDRIHFRLCKWVEVDTDNSNLITHVNEENGVLTYFVDGEGCTLRTKLKANVYMLSINNAADGVGHVYRENGTTLIDNHYYVEKDEIVVVKVEDPKIVPDVTQLELVSHENNTYKFKVLSGAEHPSISLNDHTPVLIDSNHPDWITVRKDDSTGPVLTLPDNTTFCKYMSVQMSIELKDEFDPRCYEISATGVIEYGPGQYREKESPIEEDVHITVTLTKGVLHILKSSPSSTEEEFDLVDPDDALHVYDAEDAYPIGTKMKFVPKNPKYKVDLDRCKDVSYDSGIFTITGPSPTVASKLETNVIINIPTPNDLVYEVLKDDGSVISNGAILKAGDPFKVKLKKKFFKYEANSITDCTLTNTEEQTDTHLPIYTFKINSDITATSVTVPYPTETNKVKLDVEHADQIHVLAVEDGNRTISVFPDQSIHVGEKIKAIFKSTELQELWEIKSITNATQDGENWVLTGPECKIITEKKKAHITVNATCGIDDGEITLYKSTTPGDPPIDLDTNPEFELGAKIYVKFHKYVKLDDDQSSGIESDGSEGDFAIYKLINQNAVFTTTLKDDVFEIQITIKTPGSAEVFRENETDTLESSDYIAKDEIVVVKVIDSKFVPTIDGLTQISHAGNKYKYKVTDDGNLSILIEDHTPITITSNHPEYLKVMDEYGIAELTLPDSTTYNFSSLSHSIRVSLKDGLDPSLYSFTVTGATDTGFDHIYKFNDPLPTTVMINVTVAKGTLTVTTNESADEVKVTNVAGDTEYHTGDELEIGTQIKILPKSGFIVDSTKITDIEVVDASQSIYKITGRNPKVECKRDNKVIIHIPDETHVQVTKVPENIQIHNNDNTLSIDSQIKIVALPKWEYRLKPVIGATVVDADNGIYKITAANVTIEAEPIPFITINNNNQDIVAVYTKPGNGGRITTFPCSDKIHQNQDIYVKYVNEATQKPIYDISVVGATANTEEYSYKAGVVDITVSASRKVLSATIHINHADHVTVKAVDDGRELHDGDTSVSTTQFITIVPKAYWHIKPALLRGLEATSEANKFMVIERDVFIDVEEEPLVTIDSPKSYLFNINPDGGPIINTFPNSTTLHMNEGFYIAFKTPSLKPKYDLQVTGATLMGETVSGIKYKVTDSNVIVDASLKPLPVTVRIPDETHVTVTKESNGDAVHDGDHSLFVNDKINIVIDRGYKFKLPLYGLTAESGTLYKIIGEEVIIKVEAIPFATIDNQTQAILKVSTTDVPPVELTTFPNNNTIHEGDEFTVEFKDPANIPKYTLSVTGADLVSGTKYKATTTNVVIKAERIISTATFILTGKTTVVQTFKEGNPLNHGDHIQMYEIFEVRKKNTFCTITVTGADLVPAHPGTTELISFYKVQEDVTQVVVHTEEAPYATINNVSTDLLSIRTIAVPPVEITVFPDNTSVHVNEEFTIKFKNAADAPKYNVILSGAEFISGTKYKATSTNVTIRAELKPIPATLHVVGGDANVDIIAVNDGRVLHDGDTSLVVNDQIKIVPKYGYKLKDGHITGGEELDAVNHIYKITEASVTVEVEAIPFATIDNQSPTILFVKTIVGSSVELSTFPNSDTIHVDEEFAVGFKLASNKDKYDLIITGATQIAGNIYKATTNNIVVKAESKFPPAAIHIIDGDHVDVADAMSGRVILDNDTSLFVGDKITVIPKSGYRLKQKVGLELLSKPSKLYKIANASITIEVEEIPTPPAPPPGSTHNTILWYLKSLFYGGV